MNTFVGVRLAADLASACDNTPLLYGADVLVAEGILLELLQYEMRQAGLNLTHSQDKDYVRVSGSSYFYLLLYGSDVSVTEGILLELLQYAISDLNLTNSQDKDYVRVSRPSYCY